MARRALLGFVGAEWILGKRVPSGAIGSSAGAAAEGVVFAVATASLELRGIVQCLEHRCVSIDIGDAVLPHISRHQG